MRLLRISANRSTFKTVEFNRSGLSLIVARKHEQSGASDVSKTFNGVGKSLLVYLIHFCLGAKKNDQLAEALPGWEFMLGVEIKGKPWRIVRSVDNQGVVNVNGTEESVSSFTKRLLPLAFNLDGPFPQLTFRGLLPYFLRPGRRAYNGPEQVNKSETPFAQLLRTGFLMGLDHEIISKKHTLKTRKDDLKSKQKSFASDPVVLEVLASEGNVDLEIAALDESIGQSETRLAEFKVADNYQEVEKDANGLRQRLQVIRNQAHLLEQALENIERSLSVKPDVDPEDVVRVYEEAKLTLPEAVVRSLEATKQFHADLIQKRFARLVREREALRKELAQSRAEMTKLGSQLDEQLAFLGAHGALGEFTALAARLAEFKIRRNRLAAYRELSETYAEQIQEINNELGEENLRTIKYLAQARSLLDDNLRRFRAFAKRLYPNSTSGLLVQNNDGDNQMRFDVEAKIECDASDGINEAKILCFDLMLLFGWHNHNMRFVFHDSRLFSDMDPRQRAEAFRMAAENCERDDAQYIASLNEDQLESMGEVLDSAEYTALLDDRIVLELTDRDASEKLLGVQVAIEYDD